MQNLQGTGYLQGNLFKIGDDKKQLKQEHLVQVIDGLNKRYGRDTVTWCVCGLSKKWDMRRENLSPASTTRYEDIPTAKA